MYEVHSYQICVEKWKLDSLSSIISQIEDQISDAIKEQQIHEDEDYCGILLRMVSSSIITMREIMALCSIGYSDGALSLARSMYERSIQLAFFCLHENDPDFGDYVDDYWLNCQFQAMKPVKKEARYRNDTLTLNNINQKEQALLSQTHHPKERKGDYWWTGKSTFADVAQAVQNQLDSLLRAFYQQLHVSYVFACVATVHPNGAGDSYRVGMQLPRHVISTEVTPNGQEYPLFLSTASFLLIACTACEKLAIPYDSHKDKINELIEYYQSILIHSLQEGDTNA